MCYLFDLITKYFGYNIFSTKLVRTKPKQDIKKIFKVFGEIVLQMTSLLCPGYH